MTDRPDGHECGAECWSDGDGDVHHGAPLSALAAAEARLEAVKAATVGWFIDGDASGEATLWRENDRHPVALCREGDVAGEVWSLIATALSVAINEAP